MVKKTTEMLSDKDIIKAIQEKQKEIVLSRFQIISNSLKDLGSIKKNRKEIASLKRKLILIAKGDINGKK